MPRAGPAGCGPSQRHLLACRSRVEEDFGRKTRSAEAKMLGLEVPEARRPAKSHVFHCCPLILAHVGSKTCSKLDFSLGS